MMDVINILGNWLLPEQFMPHGHCYLWDPWLLRQNVISNALVGLSYYSIPVALMLFVKKRKDLSFDWIFFMFSSFIFACGSTHFLNIFNIWWPAYRLDAALMSITAGLSVVTAIALIKLMPKLLAIPSLEVLNRTIAQLEDEVCLRSKAERELSALNADLDAKVLERTLELAQAELRFRHIVESSPNAMLVIDKQRNITFVNRKAEDVFGYGRNDLIGQPLEILLPERYRAQHPAMVAGFHRAPSTRPMGAERALFARRRDGVEIPVEIGLNPIEGLDGGATLACIIDISERMRVEIDLRRSNADLEQFAYVASHDLQEPLRMVANFTELLSQRYQGQLDSKADKYLHFANDGAKRMQRLVADLLQYSRVGSQGKLKVRTSMQKVVDGVLDLLEAPLQQCGALVDVGPLPQLVADEVQMRQLFQNLIGNAIKFRSDTLLHLRIEAQPIDETNWQFSVGDNGIGLDTTFADKIFQMFQRLHELGRYEGSGIGLAIAKRIVERHGGRIWVDSTLGAGTTFHFTLRA